MFNYFFNMSTSVSIEVHGFLCFFLISLGKWRWGEVSLWFA
jgi:hypothetical protein